METGRFRGSLSELYQCVHSVKKIFFRKNTYHIFNLLFLILMAHGSCELHVQFLQFARLFGIFTVQVLWLGGVFGQILTKRSHKSFELFKLWFPVIQSIESTCKFGLKLIVFITSKILRSNPGISRIFGLNSWIFSFFILDYSKNPGYQSILRSIEAKICPEFSLTVSEEHSCWLFLVRPPFDILTTRQAAVEPFDWLIQLAFGYLELSSNNFIEKYFQKW